MLTRINNAFQHQSVITLYGQNRAYTIQTILLDQDLSKLSFDYTSKEGVTDKISVDQYFSRIY